MEKKLKMRRWRVSVYAPGQEDQAAWPLIHKISRSFDTAQHHFTTYERQIGHGRISRVILHQGKLYRGYSSYIHDDTDWYKNSGKYDA